MISREWTETEVHWIVHPGFALVRCRLLCPFKEKVILEVLCPLKVYIVLSLHCPECCTRGIGNLGS